MSTGATSPGARPGERYTACRSLPCTRSAPKAPDTNCTCASSWRNVASCGGASRVSATVTRAAPQRTHHRAMARPEAPRPSIKMAWPCIAPSGKLGGTGLCCVSSARFADSCVTCAEPCAAPFPDARATGASSVKMRATKSAASRAAVSVFGKGFSVDTIATGVTSTATTDTASGATTCAACASTAAARGRRGCVPEVVVSSAFIAASMWTSPPNTAAW